VSEASASTGDRPTVSIGHDLYWWRHDDAGLRTTVSVYWPDGWEFERVLAVLRWFDSEGQLAAQHDLWLAADRMLSIDSSVPPVALSLAIGGSDAVLSIELFADGEVIDSDEDRHRLYGLIDWYSEAGDIVTLHSDHCVLLQPQKSTLTEIALRPWEHDDLELVFVTADEVVPAGAWSLTVTNAAGEALTCSIDEAWAPWRVHRVDLAKVFGDLVAFAGEQELSLTGRRSAQRTFARPYVVAGSPALSVYHGGDLYDWDDMPWHRYALLGEGEVNPMIVVETDEMSTDVTFFNTHGHLDDDFWVGVRVYDHAGALVAHEPKFRRVERDRIVSASFGDLLVDAERPFAGHAAFTFTEADRDAYPGRLQALMAYRGAHSTARIMAWSDEWNTPQRRIERRRAVGCYRSYFRLLAKPFLESWLGVTNAGNHELETAADYTVIVENLSGQRLSAQHTLAPWATAWSSLDEVVPGASALLDGANGLVLVESESDLAMVCFTRHRTSGRWSAEHLMSAPTPSSDGMIWPAGC
jgi:hypothetical protein